LELRVLSPVADYTQLNQADDIRMLSPDERKIEFEHRVLPLVRSFVKLNDVPSIFIENITRTLVSLDLALIPILASKALLDREMADIVNNIQQQLKPPSLADLRVRLRAEVARIDPLGVDLVMEVMERGLKISDVQHALSNKSNLRRRYDLAKKELNRIQETEKKESPASTSSSRSSTLPPLATSVKVEPQYTKLVVEDVTLEGLIGLGTKDMMRNINGDDGEAILAKVGVSKPSEKERLGIEDWYGKVMLMEGKRGKEEIIKMISAKLDVS
jgi:hypothetical protein